MKLISSRDNAWTTCRKMMYMTAWPIYELVIVTRYVSCYMYPETTLSLNKKEKLHGSWFPYWLITTYDVILPNLCIFRWCWLAQNILSYLEFKTTSIHQFFLLYVAQRKLNFLASLLKEKIWISRSTEFKVYRPVDEK